MASYPALSHDACLRRAAHIVLTWLTTVARRAGRRHISVGGAESNALRKGAMCPSARPRTRMAGIADTTAPLPDGTARPTGQAADSRIAEHERQFRELLEH